MKQRPTTTERETLKSRDVSCMCSTVGGETGHRRASKKYGEIIYIKRCVLDLADRANRALVGWGRHNSRPCWLVFPVRPRHKDPGPPHKKCVSVHFQRKLKRTWLLVQCNISSAPLTHRTPWSCCTTQVRLRACAGAQASGRCARIGSLRGHARRECHRLAVALPRSRARSMQG